MEPARALGNVRGFASYESRANELCISRVISPEDSRADDAFKLMGNLVEIE